MRYVPKLGQQIKANQNKRQMWVLREAVPSHSKWIFAVTVYVSTRSLSCSSMLWISGAELTFLFQILDLFYFFSWSNIVLIYYIYGQSTTPQKYPAKINLFWGAWRDQEFSSSFFLGLWGKNWETILSKSFKNKILRLSLDWYFLQQKTAAYFLNIKKCIFWMKI